ncbi:MAG: FMN-binding negative transcriptional regulator [Rhodoferax sp.]
MAYPNRQFQVSDPATLHALVREQPLATLVVAHQGALHVNHIPLYLEPTRGEHGTLVGHMARANGLWPLLPQAAVAVFHGPQAYVSPSWYPSKAVDGKQVPTWNYATVHAHGSLSSFDDPAELRSALQALTHSQEAQRSPAWALEDAPADYMAKLLRAIVGIRLEVQRWEGVWKMGQNRSAADHQGVVQGLRAQGEPLGLQTAALMQHIGPSTP